jgi:hypothetical protein
MMARNRMAQDMLQTLDKDEIETTREGGSR